jgi:type II secretion system protein N
MVLFKTQNQVWALIFASNFAGVSSQVRKFWRIALSLCGAVFALVAIGWIGLNLYVQSQGTQARIEQELSHRIGTTLHIRRISVTPWGGLTLSGITVPPISSASASDFLDAKSFHLHLRFISLFSKRLVINKVSLVTPTVVWPQDADGRWRLPGAQTQPSSVSSAPATARLPARPFSSLPAPLEAKPPLSVESVKPGRRLVPEVRRVKMTGGNFKFLDRSGDVVAIFERVDFHSSVRNPLELNGSAKVAKISLRDRFFVGDLRSPLHYRPDALKLSNISARIGNGTVSGHFAMQPETEDSPFSVSVNFQNVQADQIVSEAGGPKGMVQGKLEGKFEAAGKTADANALTGSGEIVLRDGQLQQYSLLVALGQILQIEELTQLHLEQAEAKYHLAPGLVTVDKLILQSPNMRLSATGTITFDGKLQLDSQLAINEKIRAKLFKPIRENFQPTDEPGYSAVNFQVGGTIDRPKSNLVERMVGRDLKDLVSGLFGGKKSKKQKPPQSTPTEAEQTTPTPTATPDLVSPAATAAPSPP